MKKSLAPPLYFWAERIIIKNFRGIKELEVSFDSRLTILVGENATGKTSILECLAKMLRFMESKLRTSESGLRTSELFEGKDIRHGQQKLTAKLRLRLVSADETQIEEPIHIADPKEKVSLLEKQKEGEIHKLREEQKEAMEALTAKWREEDEKQEAAEKEENEESELQKLKDNYEQKKASRPEDENDLKEEYGRQIMGKEARYDRKIAEIGNGQTPTLNPTDEIEYSAIFLGRDKEGTTPGDDIALTRRVRMFKNSITDGEAPRFTFAVYYPMQSAYQEQTHEAPLENEVLNAWDNALNNYAFDFKHFFAWFKWLSERKEGEDKRILNTVKGALLDFLNAGTAAEHFTEAKVSNQIFGRSDLVIMKSGTPLYASQMSSGERSLFGLVADLARRLAIANPTAADPLKEGRAIVLIDEVDLHLHPKLQTTVVPSLLTTFPKCQFIITTHSPLIVRDTNHSQIRHTKEGEVQTVNANEERDYASILLNSMGVDLHPTAYVEQLGYLKRILITGRDDSLKEAARKVLRLEFENFKKCWPNSSDMPELKKDIEQFLLET